MLSLAGAAAVASALVSGFAAVGCLLSNASDSISKEADKAVANKFEEVKRSYIAEKCNEQMEAQKIRQSMEQFSIYGYGDCGAPDHNCPNCSGGKCMSMAYCPNKNRTAKGDMNVKNKYTMNLQEYEAACAREKFNNPDNTYGSIWNDDSNMSIRPYERRKSAYACKSVMSPETAQMVNDMKRRLKEQQEAVAYYSKRIDESRERIRIYNENAARRNQMEMQRIYSGNATQSYPAFGSAGHSNFQDISIQESINRHEKRRKELGMGRKEYNDMIKPKVNIRDYIRPNKNNFISGDNGSCPTWTDHMECGK